MTESLLEQVPESAADLVLEMGPPIRGPRALSDSWSRFWHLTFNIAVMQWRTRFFGSVLGYVWQLVRPLLLWLGVSCAAWVTTGFDMKGL